MAEEILPETRKREVWRRDDFTCQFCGRIVVWEDLRIFHGGKAEDDVDGKDDLISVCYSCLVEGKKEPVPGGEDRKILKLKRDMEDISASDSEMVLKKDKFDSKVIIEKKVKELTEENRNLLDALNEKTAMAIAYKKKLDRSLTDLENYRRRTENEVALKVRDRTKGFAVSIMNVLDNLDRAIKDSERRSDGSGALNDLLSGLKNVRKAFLSELVDKGLQSIDPKSEPFDPNYHEAMGSMLDRSVQSDTVVQVISPGYVLDGKVLRAARVMVTRGGPKRPKETPPETEEMECTDDDEVEEGHFEVESGGPIIRMGPSTEEGGTVKKATPRKCKRIEPR